MLGRDLERLLTREQRGVLRRVVYSSIEVRWDGAESRCRTPESALQQAPSSAGEGGERERERERLLRPSPARTVTFGESPWASSRGGVLERSDSDAARGGGGGGGGMVVRRDIEVRRASSGLRGGGGGGKDGEPGPERPALRLFDLVWRPRRLQDDEVPHPVHWWLAGGRLQRGRPGVGVPSAATLRERRRVEVENREVRAPLVPSQ